MDLSREWSYIEQVAQHRLEHNKTGHHVAEYGTYIEVIGAAGELAARRFLQMSEDLHEHFDGGVDILYKGIPIDVKATLWTPRVTHRNLQWPIWKPVIAHAILFTAVDQERQAAIIMGYALRHQVNRAPINQDRRFPCYEIPISKLRQANSLLFAECLDDLYPGPKTQTRRRPDGNRPGAGA